MPLRKQWLRAIHHLATPSKLRLGAKALLLGMGRRLTRVSGFITGRAEPGESGRGALLLATSAIPVCNAGQA